MSQPPKPCPNRFSNFRRGLTLMAFGVCVAFPMWATPELAEATPLHLATSEREVPQHLRSISGAIGLVKVFPFQKRKKHIQCTGNHLGQGYVLTAGHCFLGALDCNKATVTFGAPSARAITGRCTRVVFNEAASAVLTGSRADYAVFQVDQFPEQAIDLSQLDAPRTSIPLAILGFPRLEKTRWGGGHRQKHTAPLGHAEGCAIASLSGEDALLRPRGSTAVVHSCPVAPGMGGALLVDAQTLAPVALNQAGSIEPKNQPDPQPHSLTVLNNIAQALSRIPDLIQFSSRPFNSDPGESLRNENTLYIGAHLPEAFPLGITEPLHMQLGEWQARDASSTITLAVQTGASTHVVVHDGSGEQHHFKGYGFFEQTSPREYVSPVRIELKTSRHTRGFAATIHLKNAARSAR